MTGLGDLWLLVRRSLRQHLLSTLVTVVSTALASGLVMAVFSISDQARRAFVGAPVGFDAVLGARGSQLQLVLNTLFHLETSPGNIPWSLYEAVRKRPYVELAVPYAVGDNYRGFRIVGTTDEMFSRFELEKGRRLTFAASDPAGRAFDPALREAVIGSFAAQQTGLHVGSRFNPYHGLQFDEAKRHDEEYVVVGVLAPSNSPSDRVIWIPIEGIFRMSDHVLRGGGQEYTARPGQAIPDEFREVSAVMLKFKTDERGRGREVGFVLEQEINRQGKVATLAFPIANVLRDLFDKIGWFHRVLALVAYLVVAVATGAILASIYNTLNERRREFAILRALGARRFTVFSVILVESAAIAAMGAAAGFGVFAAILGAAAAVIRAQTGVALDPLFYHPILWAAPLGMIALGALAGTLPAVKAYSTDVATNLTPTS
ncbi:FtsX-like permease family protein [Phycisphaerae bacterium RAS1]|nr:FtsX-like permease family protein [Phycisphaerae bacterium RAS1]